MPENRPHFPACPGGPDAEETAAIIAALGAYEEDCGVCRATAPVTLRVGLRGLTGRAIRARRAGGGSCVLWGARERRGGLEAW